MVMYIMQAEADAADNSTNPTVTQIIEKEPASSAFMSQIMGSALCNLNWIPC
jgi:hypothetical protein